MIGFFKKSIKKIFNSLGFDLVRISQKPNYVFLSSHYHRHNQRRLEHLASLRLDLANSTILEVGAGIGDHTNFFIDRGCQVVTSDGREENIEILRSRYPDLKVLHLDLDTPPETFSKVFDIVYCYGLLYHLKNPERAIKFMSSCCRRMLLLETCVSFGEDDLLNPCIENPANPTQSTSGMGCRPTRRWIYNQLKRYFEFVYLPITQPNHEEFPIDWTSPPSKKMLTRAIFIGSRRKIINELLIEDIPMKQIRH
jgi:hypothetical protein